MDQWRLTDLFVDEQAAETVLLDALGVFLCADTTFSTSCVADDNLALKMVLRSKHVLPDTYASLSTQLHQWEGFGRLDNNGLVAGIGMTIWKDDLELVSRTHG